MTMASMIGVLDKVGVVPEAVTVRATMSWHLGGQLLNAVRTAMSAIALCDWAAEHHPMAPPPLDGSLNVHGRPVHRTWDEPELTVLVVGYRNGPDDTRGVVYRFADDAASFNIVAARLVTLTTAVTIEEWAAARADALTLVGQLAQQATESPHDATSVHTSSTLRPAL